MFDHASGDDHIEATIGEREVADIPTNTVWNPQRLSVSSVLSRSKCRPPARRLRIPYSKSCIGRNPRQVIAVLAERYFLTHLPRYSLS